MGTGKGPLGGVLVAGWGVHGAGAGFSRFRSPARKCPRSLHFDFVSNHSPPRIVGILLDFHGFLPEEGEAGASHTPTTTES